jgi:type I restriction enzyme, S subunit
LTIEALPVRHVLKRHAVRKTLLPNDIIIETAGGSKDRPTGRTVFVSSDRVKLADYPLVPASFARFLRVNNALVSPGFLFWKLQAMYADRTLRKYHTQHTGVSRFQFTTFATGEHFDLPNRPVQDRIASVLFAYDDLIENNAPRIAILEEMARRIFEEWFVQFRAPGCEGLPLIDSPIGPIPQGWEVAQLGEIAELSGASLTPTRFPDETFAHFSYPAFDAGQLPRAEPGRTIQSNKLCFDAPCVLLGKLNPRIPRIWLVFEGEPLRMVASTEFIPLRPARALGLAHLYSLVCSDGFMTQVKGLTGGTSTSHQRATPSNVMALRVRIPPNSLVYEFDQAVMPVLRLRECLRRNNANLRAQRDLLLPKLISGEIEISAAAASLEEAAE